MIFHKQMIDKILAGEKTVTRRPVSYGYTRGSVSEKGIALSCRYKVGRTYAIQPGRGAKAVGRLRVTSVSLEVLGTIDSAEAKLEGFKTRTGFQEYWRNLYGRLPSTQLVHRIEFEPVEAEG